MFSEVKLTQRGNPESPEMDLLVDVKERKTGRFEIGYLYGEVEGGAFLMNVRELNLALQPPFRGDALQGNFGLTLGSEIRRVDLGLRNPRLGYSAWSLDGALFYEDSEYVSDYYNQQSQGGSLLAGYPLGRHHVISTGYATTDYDLYDIEPAYAAMVTNYETDVSLTSWVVTWNMEHTDLAFRPTQGVRARSVLQVGSDLLGGDTEVIQVNLEGAGYLNPFGEHVVIFRAGLESADPYGSTASVPLPLRIFLGGAGNLRGFGYNTVSPMDDDGLLVGGESAWWASAEYLFPLTRRIDLAVYYDLGDVSEQAYDFAGDGPVSDWGVGLLVRAENFPVRFDVAFPLDTYEYDRENEKGDARFSFSAGYRF